MGGGGRIHFTLLQRDGCGEWGVGMGREGKFSSTLPGSVLLKLKREIKCTLLKRGGVGIKPTLDYKVCVCGGGGGAEEN